MNWDTFYQIYQCYPGNHPLYDATGVQIDAYFSDHHPIFDTLLYGFFAASSDALFGSKNYGVFAFVSLQALITAFSFGLSACYLEKLSVPPLLRVFSLLFFALFPPLGIYAVTMLKDSLFSWIYVIYFLLVIELVRTRGSVASNWKYLVGLVLVCVFLALTKKTGIYLVLVVGIVLALAFRQHWKRLTIPVLASAFVMFIVLPLVVFPLLSVEKGGKQEMLAPLFQQTARFVKDNPGMVSDDERIVIDKVLGFDTLSDRYDFYITDSVKSGYNPNATAQDIQAYLKVWVAEGLRNPRSYIEATMGTAHGFFAPVDTISIYSNTGSTITEENVRLWNPKFLEPLRLGVTDAYYRLADSSPISLLFSIALYAWWIPLFSCWLAVTREKRWIWAFIPVIVTILFCWISPYSWARYALPLIYTAPLIVALVFGKIEKGIYTAQGKENRQLRSAKRDYL